MRLVLTDIAEHATAKGDLYPCAVQDACSSRIVGYSIETRMTAALGVQALRNALAPRGPKVLEAIVHSDRGSQFCSHCYVREFRTAADVSRPSGGTRRSSTRHSSRPHTRPDPTYQSG